MRQPTNPMKMRAATKEFTGTCGHTIKAGDDFVLVEPRPVFSCEKCARKPSERPSVNTENK